MSDRFEGQVVLVAGGTGGLGRAVSLAFLDERAAVIVTYRAQGEFDALVPGGGSQRLTEKLEGQRVDVTDEAERANCSGTAAWAAARVNK